MRFFGPSFQTRLTTVKATATNSFNMGEWGADETAEVTQGCESYCRALMWIVPAKVEGTWALGDKKLAIQQNFQKFEGTLGNAAADSAISEGRLTDVPGDDARSKC